MKNFFIAFGLCLVTFTARAQFDIYGTTTATLLATNTTLTATTTNAGVDVHGYVGQPVLILSYTNGVGTNATLDVRVQTSASLATGYTDVSGAAFTQVTNAIPGAAGILTIGVNPNAVSKYIRVVQTIGGTDTPTFDTSIIMVGRLKYQ